MAKDFVKNYEEYRNSDSYKNMGSKFRNFFDKVYEAQSNKKETQFKPGEYDYDAIYNDLLKSGAYSSGSRGGGTFKPDVSSFISAYDQQNEAANAIAKAKYDSTRANLLTALNRAEQQNALDVLKQSQSHANNLSSLESAGTEAARNARIQTAMRGLSGSGIAQLNQLKNMINQGNKTTAVAQSNVDALDKLRQSLATSSNNTNNELAKILEDYTNTVTKSNQNAAKSKADAIWNVESEYASNLAKAAAANAQSEADMREAANDIYTNLRNSTLSLQGSMKAIKKMSTKELKKYVLANGLENDLNTLVTLNGDSVSKLGTNDYRNYVAQVLGQKQYNTINELNNTYGINPYNYRTGMNNISGLLYNYQNK